MGESCLGKPRLAVERCGMAKEATIIRPVSNGAKTTIEALQPYNVTVTIKGVADILFHAWNNEAVEAKSKAAKGSKAKKSDDLESYVYRCENGNLGIKGVALHRAIVEIGRYYQDPRSPRKSARDLMKAAIIPTTLLADTGVKDWDYIDRQRVIVQQSAITRERPALRSGWTATFTFIVNVPEYVTPELLNEMITQAGRLNGLGDFRPTYGRFVIWDFKVSE